MHPTYTYDDAIYDNAIFAMFLNHIYSYALIIIVVIIDKLICYVMSSQCP